MKLRALPALERWQGMYASGPQEFLRETPADGVTAIAATTGIGMTCGLGLAESAIIAALTPTTRHTIQTTPSTRRTEAPS